MTAFLADAKFEGIEAEPVAQCGKTAGFVLRGDLAALHARGIDREWTRRAAEEAADALSCPLALEVPKSRIETRQGAEKVGTGIFVLALGDQRHQSFDVAFVFAEGPARHLTVKNGAGDVGIVR
jgi:hypothetical protein